VHKQRRRRFRHGTTQEIIIYKREEKTPGHTNSKVNKPLNRDGNGLSAKTSDPRKLNMKTNFFYIFPLHLGEGGSLRTAMGRRRHRAVRNVRGVAATMATTAATWGCRRAAWNVTWVVVTSTTTAPLDGAQLGSSSSCNLDQFKL
jgi:hypothetical protein